METNPEFIVDHVDTLLKEHFETHPATRPKLGTFCPPEDGLLKSLWKEDVACPQHPIVKGRPSLLIHDLENTKHKDSAVYKHIAAQQSVGPTCLYGTSGIGQTRSILEYLSHNKGFYLLAGGHDRNPGSKDLYSLFEIDGKRSFHDEEEESRRLKSDYNLNAVLRRYQILLFIRYRVHEFLEDQLGGRLSAWEWLMYQLYPQKFLGLDLFGQVLESCNNELFEREDCLIQLAISARQQVKGRWSIFVDESQRLLKIKSGYFWASEGKKLRSNFSALAQALLDDHKKEILGKDGPVVSFPVFSGTDLSVDEIPKESGSVVAKKRLRIPLGHHWLPLFSSLEMLGEGQVIDCMSQFLDLQRLSADVTNHVARWLRGRPRWTATFLEIYVTRGMKDNISNRTRIKGDCSDNDRKMLDAIDRFLSLTTCNDEVALRRAGWNLGSASAFAMVDALNPSTSETPIQCRNEFETAVFKFAVGCKASVFGKKDISVELIKSGVCAVEVETTTAHRISCILDEPIVVQAALNAFSLTEYLQSTLKAEEEDGLGQAFEKLLLPFLVLDSGRETLNTAFREQLTLNDTDELGKFNVSTTSSYGVLVEAVSGTSTEAIEATIDWISRSTTCRIEGEVPPICLPDEKIGPDAIYLLWNENFSEFRPCLVQSKYEKFSCQNDALLTLVPDPPLKPPAKKARRMDEA